MVGTEKDVVALAQPPYHRIWWDPNVVHARSTSLPAIRRSKNILIVRALLAEQQVRSERVDVDGWPYLHSEQVAGWLAVVSLVSWLCLIT